MLTCLKFFFVCCPFFLLKILGHQKGGALDLVLDLDGLGIDALDLGPETDAAILLALDPKKDGTERKRESVGRKAFLPSSPRPRAVRSPLQSGFCMVSSCRGFKVFPNC